MSLLDKAAGSTPRALNVEKIGQHFLQKHVALHTTKAALGQILSLDPKGIEDGLCTLGSVLHNLDQVERYLLEKCVSQSDAELVAYFDINKYDETPMRVSQRQSLTEVAGHAVAEVSGSSSSATQTNIRPSERFLTAAWMTSARDTWQLCQQKRLGEQKARRYCKHSSFAPALTLSMLSGGIAVSIA